MSKQTADVICRALLAIVAALRKEYNLPDRHNITVLLSDTVTEIPKYDIMPETK